MKVDHHKSLSPEVLDAAYKLFADASAAYNARGAADYDEYLKKIPYGWRNKYHYILQWGPMWFGTLLEINRGREVEFYQKITRKFETFNLFSSGLKTMRSLRIPYSS